MGVCYLEDHLAAYSLLGLPDHRYLGACSHQGHHFHLAAYSHWVDLDRSVVFQHRYCDWHNHRPALLAGVLRWYPVGGFWEEPGYSSAIPHVHALSALVPEREEGFSVHVLPEWKVPHSESYEMDVPISWVQVFRKPVLGSFEEILQRKFSLRSVQEPFQLGQEPSLQPVFQPVFL